MQAADTLDTIERAIDWMVVRDYLGAGAREQEIGEGVTDSPNAELIYCSGLSKEVDDVQRPAAVAFGVVEPGEGRGQA